jgi:hypothetical protein
MVGLLHILIKGKGEGFPTKVVPLPNANNSSSGRRSFATIFGNQRTLLCPLQPEAPWDFFFLFQQEFYFTVRVSVDS